MIRWSGIVHIMATPFLADGALDVEGIPRLVESALATGITGFTVLGIAGEAHRLTDEKRRGWIEHAYVRPPASVLDAPTVEELGEVLAAVVPA